MKTATKILYVRPTEQERRAEFSDNLTIKTNDDGSLYLETYASTIGGSCSYGQYYKPGVTKAEAIQRFNDFYWPLNQQDNEE